MHEDGVVGSHCHDILGEPAELWEERVKLLEPYRVTKDVMASSAAIAMTL